MLTATGARLRAPFYAPCVPAEGYATDFAFRAYFHLVRRYIPVLELIVRLTLQRTVAGLHVTHVWALITRPIPCHIAGLCVESILHA